MSHSSHEKEREDPRALDNKMFFDAIAKTLEKLNMRIDALEQHSTTTNEKKSKTRIVFDEESDWEDEEEIGSTRRRGRNIREVRRGREEKEDGNLSSIKMRIPEFKGRNDADTYLEWERKVEMIFECHNYSENKKVKLAAVEFTDYALVWWDQLLISRRRCGEEPISTWSEMKRIMRKRFVPSYYYREQHQKLQRLVQGSQTVEEYHKEMEMAMIRANIEEDGEATMARFLNGLNKDVADVVELQHYVELEDMLNMAMKVERRLRSRSSSKAAPSSSSSWNSRWPRKEERPRDKPNTMAKDSAKGSNAKVDLQGNSKTSQTRNIKCFRCLGQGHIASACPNKRAMIITNSGDIESEHESDPIFDDMPLLEDRSDVENDDSIELPHSGECLVVQRALNAPLKEEDSSQQRENLFHTRGLIGGKVCSIIVDNGSVTNVASTVLVAKLGLKWHMHPKPYKLHWLNDCGELKVNKQVLASTRINPGASMPCSIEDGSRYKHIDDVLKIPSGPTTRSKSKKMKGVFQTYGQSFISNELSEVKLNNKCHENRRLEEDVQYVNLIELEMAGQE